MPYRHNEPRRHKIPKARLQAMGQRTPRGGLRWSRSSVKNLLDRAREQGLVREAQRA